MRAHHRKLRRLAEAEVDIEVERGIGSGLTIVLGRDLGLVWRFDLVFPSLSLSLRLSA